MNKKIIFLTVSFIVSGCANLEPIMPNVDSNLPSQWGENRAVTYPIPNWNEIFKSSLIQNDIALALAVNKDIKKAALTALRSHQLINTVKSPLSLSTGMTGDYQGDYDTISNTNGVLQLSFDLDLWGRIELETKVATLNAESSDLSLKGVQDAIASEVIRAHCMIAYTHQYHRVLNDMDQVLSSLETRANARTEEGLLNHSDLSRIKIKKNNIQALRVQLDYKKSVALEALKILTSYHYSNLNFAQSLEEIEPAYFTLPNPTSSSIVFNRPDIKSLEQKMKASNAQIGVIKASRLPQIHLPFSFFFPAYDANIWEILPSITQIIFDGGRLKAIEEVTTTERDIALVEYEKGLQSAYRDVANGLAYAKAMEQEVEIATKTLVISQRAFNYASFRNHEGVESLSDLIDCYDDLFIANSHVIKALIDRVNAAVSLFASAGVGV